MTFSITPDGFNLIQAGAVLFFIGLLQGLAIPKYKNSRMGLSAHLTAVQCGMALMIFGVIWQLTNLEHFWLYLAKWGFLISVYMIWLGITVAAHTGASKALPIAGKGFAASKLSENLVTILEVIGVLFSLVSIALIVIGLFRN